jgi:3',5'-cyclic AMP phosphodiesterase CpdA
VTRRTVIILAVVQQLVGLALMRVPPAMPAAAQDFFFIQAADPQFGLYTADGDFAQETANFEFVIATANRLRPAFVVVCGDLVNKPGDAAQIAEYQRIAHELDAGIPLYSVAGNHDVGNSPTPELLAAYRKVFGPDYYSFRHDNFTGIVIDSSLIQHPENAPEDAAAQEKWLREELDRAGDPRTHPRVVFQHIPWFLERADEPDQYFNLPVAARPRFFELFQRTGVNHVFAGHYHRNAIAEGPRLQVITTGPVGKPLGPDPSGIRIVHVTPAGIRSRYYGLGNMPNQLEASGMAEGR